MLWCCCDTVWQWHQMRHWVQAQARILESGLETHTSSGGRGGGSSTSYRATARYQYVYENVLHTGIRVGIDSSADGFGSYQQDVAARLQRAQHTEEPLPCYVNPANPSDAVLDRSLRVGFSVLKGVFGLIFGGVGALIGGVGLRELRRRRAVKARGSAQEEDRVTR